MSATDAAEKQAGGFSMLVGDGWNLVAYRCAWIAVVLSQLSLIALIQHPPLLDYPNHLARAYVLRHLVDVAAFQSTWQAAWAPLPNLAMDLVMLPLQPAFGIERAGKIFLCLTILIGHAGVHLLGKAIHGRPTWLALPAMFFVLNTSFLHGFVNYSFGLGLFLVAMAYWIPRRDTPSIGATIGGSLLALGCYLSHLSSIVFLALGVGTFVVADLVAGTIRRRTAILALLLFVVPLVLFLSVPRGQGPLIWSSPVEKLRALGWLFRAYDRTTDLGVAVLMLIAAGLLLHGRDRIATWGRATLFATVLGLLYFAFPSQTIGTWAADRRFLYPAAIVAVLSVRLEVSRQAARIALSLVVLVLLARSVYVHRSWSWLDARIEAQRQLLREVAPGSRIFAVSSDALWTDLYGMAFPHVVAYAAISSHAVVPLFADPTQQPLVARDAAVSASSSGPETASSTTIEESEWTNIISAYQYVWVNGATAADRTMLSRHCSAIAEAEGALLASACHVDAR